MMRDTRISLGRYFLVQRYFCADYNYSVKVDLSKAVGIQKENYRATTHLKEKIELTF